MKSFVCVKSLICKDSCSQFKALSPTGFTLIWRGYYFILFWHNQEQTNATYGLCHGPNLKLATSCLTNYRRVRLNKKERVRKKDSTLFRLSIERWRLWRGLESGLDSGLDGVGSERLDVLPAAVAAAAERSAHRRALDAFTPMHTGRRILSFFWEHPVLRCTL